MQQPSRRALLIGGGATVASLLGGTIVHAYTGPVALHFFNYASTTREVGLTLSESEQTAFSAAYDVPPATEDDVGERFEERIIETAIHGTTYRVSLTLDEGELDETWTYTPTCTGYSEQDGDRLTDELHIDLLAEESSDDARVQGSSCGSIL